MRRILVGFDGSEGAENALNKAMMLINEHGEIFLIAVVPFPSESNLMDTNTHELMKQKAQNLIKSVIQDIGIHDYSIQGIVKEGDIAGTIIDTANELNCEMVILGSKGKSELGNYPIGSVANKVVQYAHKPVMVVR
jgi:nucleotide-binding universal stress UspA family protein